MKTLRVCLSKDLPSIENRSSDFIYFLYDKLTVFDGQSLYHDPYAIVSALPENAVNGMLYFVLDGSVRMLIDKEEKTLGMIESDTQLDLLKKSGTTFFTYSDMRYLDLQRRIITLPYHNGTYELTVSVANELMYDKDTVIAFNPETNRFDIIGKKQDYDLVFTNDYRGKGTKSVDVKVEEHTISSDVKISNSAGNMIYKLGNGLYASGLDKVTKEEFNLWVDSFRDYKYKLDLYLEDLTDKVKDAQELISEESITTKILSALESEYPEIEKSLTAFDEMAAKFEGIEERCSEYTLLEFESAKQEINDSIIKNTSDPWESFGDDSPLIPTDPTNT